MRINITNIYVDTNSLQPALKIRVDIEYVLEVESPFSISGILQTIDMKSISYLNEFEIPSMDWSGLKLHYKYEKKNLEENKKFGKYNAVLTALLSPKAIEHIENLRDKNNEKSVVFYFTFAVKHIEIPCDPESFISMNHSEELIHITMNSVKDIRYTILQSDWIQNFAPKLGIGNFLLLELQVPDDNNYIDEYWKELYNKLSSRIKNMQIEIRNGNWEATMYQARKYYENIKLNDGKSGHIEFEKKLKTLFFKDNHNEYGYKCFLDGIWKFFEFISQFVHDEDKSGNSKVEPFATKEDCFFVYALAIGLLNIIGKKVCKKNDI